MRDVDHMVGIHRTEWGQSVAHDGKEGDESVVNDIDHITLLGPNGNPSDEEEHPCKPKQGDERGVKRDEKAKRSTDVSPKAL